MKTTLLASLLSANLWACPAGTVSWEGACSADLQPEKAIQTVQPSDEKPSLHPEPAYQRGEVHADTPPSLITQDQDLDTQKAQAEAEGKRKAGIR